jgi:TRAP-type uncharacterized transport system substrate-binding protein
MFQSIKKRCFALPFFILAMPIGVFTQTSQSLAQTPKPTPPAEDALYSEEKQRTNAWTVSIMVSGLNCTCMQFAEDIRNVVNDLRPGGQRTLISIGEGGPHNLKDMNFLLGVHMSIVDENDLKRLKESDTVVYGNADEKFRYITKLHNAELHILARTEIKSLADLNGKPVNVELAGSQSDYVATRIFGSLGIKITPTHFDDALAQEKLLNGELAATVLSTGAPQESLQRLKQSDGVHFLALDEASLPGYDLNPVMTEYLPAELTSEYYPNLIAAGETIPTVASRMILAIFNWPEKGEHYNRDALFTAAFFNKIEQFRHASRHPKWKEVNIAAEVPGWTRFKPAQEWLDQNQGRMAGAGQTSQTVGSPDAPKTAFDTFVTQRTETTGQAISASDRETLFTQFQKFWESQIRRGQER